MSISLTGGIAGSKSGGDDVEDAEIPTAGKHGRGCGGRSCGLQWWYT